MCMLLNYINSLQIFQKMQISQNIINTQLGNFLLRLLGAMGHGEVRYRLDGVIELSEWYGRSYFYDMIIDCIFMFCIH